MNGFQNGTPDHTAGPKTERRTEARLSNLYGMRLLHYHLLHRAALWAAQTQAVGTIRQFTGEAQIHLLTVEELTLILEYRTTGHIEQLDLHFGIQATETDGHVAIARVREYRP